MKVKNIKYFPPLHIILFAIYFPVFLYSKNIHRFYLSVFWGPAFIILISVILIWAFLLIVLKNKERAGLFTSLNLLFAFFFGALYEVVNALQQNYAIAIFGINKILLGLWLLLNVLLFWFCYKKTDSSKDFTKALNLTSLILLLFPLTTILRFEKSNATYISGDNSMVVKNMVDKYKFAGNMKPLPDVYHIILDAYSRHDVLKEHYNFDNTDFLNFLRAKGFFVFDKSFSNYTYTDLSVTSTLNFDYLDRLLNQANKKSKNWKDLVKIKIRAKSVLFLKSIGYKHILVTHGWETKEPQFADIVLRSQQSLQGIYLNEFQNGLLSMTPVPYFLRIFKTDLIDYDTQHRKRVLFALNYLDKAVKEKEPRYVFCHILAPHMPIVFGPDGEQPRNLPDFHTLLESDSIRFINAVSGEIQYLNSRMKKIINNLIMKSKGEVVILLQSDHGEPTMPFREEARFYKQRHGILAAVHLPKSSRDSSAVRSFYPSMTPVNFYRYIFNNVYGLGLNTLPDKILFSDSNTPYNFTDITDSL